MTFKLKSSREHFPDLHAKEPSAMVVFVFLALIVGAAILWKASVWNECRSEGHSLFYCLSLLGN